MSSLGDLLLFHSKANKADKVSESESCDNDNKESVRNRQTNQELPSQSQSSNFPQQQLNIDSNNSDNNNLIEENVQQQSSPPLSVGVTKVFPKHIERNEIEETQSNASSTDDYVRELLDPDDRPKNVWHIVEGPKIQQNDDNSSNNNLKSAGETPNDLEPSSRPSLDNNDDDHGSYVNQLLDIKPNIPDELSNDLTSSAILTPSTPPIPGSPTQLPQRSEDASKEEDQMQVDDRDIDAKHRGSKEKRSKDYDRKAGTSRKTHSSSRHDSRERSSPSSRKHRHPDEHRDRNRNRSKDRDDRYRSSRRRHDYSDDDDADGYDKHRSSHRRRRSHSRSSRTSSSRRRDRSRSNSQSPINKRNSRTILIMQLSPRVNSRDLEEFFCDLGKVREVRLIMDSKTRRHKGIAYIEFEDSHAASKAFALNGKKLFGVPLVIQSAQSDRNRPSSGDWQSSSTSHHQTSNYTATSSSHSSSRPHLPPSCYRVYVGGLNIHLTEDMIRSVFEPFGPIVRIELMRDRVTNISRGYAFVTYADGEDGQSAVQALDGFELAGKNLRVSKSTDKSERFPNTTSTTTTTGSNSDYGQSTNVGDLLKDDENPYANHHKYK